MAARTSAPKAFYEAGTPDPDKIYVELNYQIIGLFSEGLYSSPHKAIEELVSNSFDADATTVSVVITPDRGRDGSIAVFDNGTGMDDEGLRIHWIVGKSKKAGNRGTAKGRKTIGKFGIGKLAAYVLGNRLTHITKADGKYYATSMDFTQIPQSTELNLTKPARGSTTVKPVTLDLRILTAEQAKEALRPWLTTPSGRGEMQLFGRGAAPSWTVAIISDLKGMAGDVRDGTLKWVLQTAMPLREDFSLYFNGAKIEPSKLGGKKVGRWVLGKDLSTIPKPAAAMVESTDPTIKAPDYHHWVLTDKRLGPVTGFLEVYEEALDKGKSNDIDRSNGFFVYVNGRLINPEDAGFGISRNLLRHGTFSRFRLVINIDRLDDELRSSRETLRQGVVLEAAQNLLQGIFNFARGKLDDHSRTSSNTSKASQRLADSPASLTEKPILRLLLDTYEERVQPRHVEISDTYEDGDAFREHVEQRIEDTGSLVNEVSFEDLGPLLPMAMLDGSTGKLSINLEHPFVAHFADEFNDSKRNLPLQLFAIAEILLEAQLNEAGIGQPEATSVMDDRDELLRHLARSSGARSSLTVAQDLVAAKSTAKPLELAVVAAFNQLGFVAVPKAGNDEVDGLADAHLPGDDGRRRSYRVALEAKSKEKPGGKVKKSAVQVSTIARHRDETDADHALVVGPEFETGAADSGAVIREIDADRANSDGRTITLMRVDDLARLVRYAPVKRVNLMMLRELFEARTPNEAAAWVDKIVASQPEEAPYRDILEIVFEEQRDASESTVDYGSVRTALRRDRKISILESDLKDECRALARMAPGMFYARDDRVELATRPDKVLEKIHDYVGHVPDGGS